MTNELEEGPGQPSSECHPPADDSEAMPKGKTFSSRENRCLGHRSVHHRLQEFRFHTCCSASFDQSIFNYLEKVNLEVVRCAPGVELFVPVWPRRPYVLCVQVLEGRQGLKQGIVDNVENPACLDGNFGVVQLCLLEKKLDWALSWNKVGKGRDVGFMPGIIIPISSTRRYQLSMLKCNYEASTWNHFKQIDERRNTYLEISVASFDNWKGNYRMNGIR